MTVKVVATEQELNDAYSIRKKYLLKNNKFHLKKKLIRMKQKQRTLSFMKMINQLVLDGSAS